MLKNPYGSRVFGHLFDLVRTVMHCALPRAEWTKRIFTPLTQALTKAVCESRSRKTGKPKHFFGGGLRNQAAPLFFRGSVKRLPREALTTDEALRSTPKKAE